MIILKLQSILEYIYINIVNSIILYYIDIKNIKNDITEMVYSPNLLKFNYKKLFYYIIKEFKGKLIILIKTLFKIIEINKYTFQKYVLKYSFIKFIINYLSDLDITNLENHIYNKLDLYYNCKNLIIEFITIIRKLIIEYKDYRSDKVYILNNHIRERHNTSLASFILDKITKIIDTNNCVSLKLEDEIELSNIILNSETAINILSILPLNKKEVIKYMTILVVNILYDYLKKISGINKIVKIVTYCLDLIYYIYYRVTQGNIDIHIKTLNLVFYLT